MESLDEFQELESMLKKSEDSLIKHQRKKHKSELINNNNGHKNNSDDNNHSAMEECSDVEFLEHFILNTLNKQDDLRKRDEIIKKLASRLQSELQDKEAIRQSEQKLVYELEDIKRNMKQYAALVQQYKQNMQHKVTTECECQTDSVAVNGDHDSLEVCRRQAPHHSTLIDGHNGHSEVDKSPVSPHSPPTTAQPNGCDPKTLLDQMRQYEEKFQAERLNYIEENDRLNRILEQNLRVIDELRFQLRHSTSSNSKVISTSAATAASLMKTTFIDAEDSKDYSRVQGLFDWPIEEPVSDQAMTLGDGCDGGVGGGDIVFEQANAYQSGTTNNRMLHVLSDLVKTFLDTENDIQKQLESLGLENNNNNNKSTRPDLEQSQVINGIPSLDDERVSEITFELSEDGPDLTPSSMVYSNNNSFCPNQSSSGGANGSSGSNDIEDDVVLGASRRLRLAVERVLRILTEVVDHHSKHDLKELSRERADLALELQEEALRRDQLTSQLLEAETQVHSLECEKQLLTDQLVDYAEVKAEHEALKAKVEEFERDRDRFLTDHRRFESEKSTFSQGLPQLQQKLSHQNESLNREVHQLQQEKANLMKKINNLTSDVETLRSEKDQIIEIKNGEFEELVSQMEATEKNLSALKRFMEEQTQERETEREDYNREIAALKEKLREREKTETKLKSNVRSLESQLSLLTDDKSLRDDQIESLSLSLKETNLKVAELNLTVRQLETDLERSNQVEAELRSKLTEVSGALNVKINDGNNWDDLINVIAKLAESKPPPTQSSSAAAKSDDKKRNGSDATDGGEGHSELDSLSSSQDNSIFLTVKLMDDKIRLLNEEVDNLISKNASLQSELTKTGECAAKLDSIKREMGGLEKLLTETQKENEMLRQEINDNHMKYSELKVKLESSVDAADHNRVVADLQSKLVAEKRQTESVTVKLDQVNRHVHELEEKLDAYRREIKSYKDLIKSHEHESKVAKERGEYKGKYDSAVAELAQVTAKVTSKEKTIAVLEQSIEKLKSRVNVVTSERDLYLEKLQSLDDSHNKVVIYEKNLEKLRLQNKMSSDKIVYLELEIKSLRKKIEILERENDYLKVENRKLQKQRHEMITSAATAMSESDDNVDALLAVPTTTIANNNNQNHGQQFLNGLDKVNGISSNNLLMLKVRRLLSQKGALIYQKNYLIHLLGGFQMTENATLALLANLNHTRDPDIDEFEVKMRGRQRFRSVAYALIALNRMRIMVNIWQCRKRQLMLSKTASSMSSVGLQPNMPLPPRRKSVSSVTSGAGSGGRLSNSSSSSSSSSATSPVHFPKHTTVGQINSTMKDYVDRLHVVHETLGLHTNKL